MRRAAQNSEQPKTAILMNDQNQSDGGSASNSTALFIPLKRQFFEEFERGEKQFEYRTYGARWNEKTCEIGRKVTLSMGYGKQRRLSAEVVSFDTCATPQLIPGWKECFGDSHFTAAVIGIRILGMNVQGAEIHRSGFRPANAELSGGRNDT